MRPAQARAVRTEKHATWSRLMGVDSYDRSADLTAEERAEVRRLTRQGLQSRSWFKAQHDGLERLLRPVRDLTQANRAVPTTCASVVKVLVTEMNRRQSSFWAWTAEQWEETLRPTIRAFEKRYQARSHARPLLLALSFIYGCLNDPRRLGPFDRAGLARRVFGSLDVDHSIARVQTVLRGWGYAESPITNTRMTTRLCEALLINKSPHLEDVTLEFLERLRESHQRTGREQFQRLSRALVHLGILRSPLSSGFEMARGRKLADLTVGVSPGWVTYLKRWQDSSTLEPRTRKEIYFLAMKAGRWVNRTHPEAASPEAWTRETAAAYVAEVRRMRVGDWTAGVHAHKAFGKPLTAVSQASHLWALRTLFRDWQEWGWTQRRFDPGRCMALPRSVRNLIGPNPRLVADDKWAKLVWAGLSLSALDLNGSSEGQGAYYPLEIAKALVVLWLFAGLRSNEIRRLRVGCIRWNDDLPAQNKKSSEQRVCLLDVPVNKTGTAFTKPVDPAVGEAIGDWERVRPEQPLQLDSKTGEMVHFLFTFRGHQISLRYLNRSLIPLLCRKAGVPQSDARGRITSHRARATIASQLLNAKQPLSLLELQEWLGHRSAQSTRYYAKISPTRLARSYSEADYFTRNLRTLEVLIDQGAIRSGTAVDKPWKFYDLGHGYCTYDFFDQCPHRMACAKCSFYRPKGSTEAQLLEGKTNLLRMRQEIPLGEAERAAVEDGVAALEALIHKLVDVPTPAGPTPRQLQTARLIQLPGPPTAPQGE